MRSECFLDTNILIYAAAGKNDEPHRHRIAYDLVLNSRFGVSGQTLVEFYWSVLRKPLIPPPLAEVDGWIDLLAAQPFAAVGANLVRAGLFLSRRFRIAYWDAALVAAADRFGAAIFYTEDLNHGQYYGSVVAVDRFRAQ